ncbi:MAG: hypothetical protein A3C43_05375 [Candidatus Schekmanbacteria bacterium RIFCSPHIGHO2_02_FULL_38_11]|uniref:2-deoxy-D-gluconate 3-dehydrogenase n=1 Tax=Candidatus Schekmanbacteria bacterium RIFCSPLOWO2_12_FULL_38_15 TaxID=1817883 RepID=A0A1F7SC93_9BACT|nr:MAG: hypothetical protein A2043_03160 [Candidatus Schekmanbacteria bacterium GWA2_38_9]OGL51402.1 MAG: hypothetical protein A3G31_05990 [Candidatus Schekmanbacteria bacterium RIFCSPLOWO2_12_FULL_38_15]OGL51591.1 MAG: hypothetical protein A3H37_09575 [Candidatus Schekmanbacteria bacterium RIFCSPLOWO2_02_FULL_38_14]OGL53214.1 MAG: hypothetical protein A3C43_05375 [Candidatus Schekmanbacteria bacterium RIFCSPHIGHO2_02_FULL_38_11]
MSLKLFDLTGKIAIVTGASKGLGKAMSLGMADAGADIVLVSRTLKDLEVVAEEIRAKGRKALPVPADVSKNADIERMVKEAMGKFGKIDILVNNTGISGDKPVLKMEEEYWDYVMSVNLKAPFLCSKAVGAEMVKRKKGKIINISSITFYMAIPNMTSYCASKAGVVQFTKALALEWARYNIQVNAICPGYFRTPMNEKFFSTDAGKKIIEQTLPFKRLGEPEELVGSVVFLASDASNFITGAVLVVDGGQILGK